MNKLNVAVLMGGKSAERDVSLSTGNMILKALDAEKYNSYPIDTSCFENSPDAEIPSLSNIIEEKPDIAFIALHGKFGEDGTVQGMLELLEIPYVGSGVLASALAMDKIMARKIMEYESIPIPRGISVCRPFDMETLINRIQREIGLPAVVKPNCQGSTIGLTIARNVMEIPDSIDLAFEHDTNVLIEEFVEGIEITVSVLGNDLLEALPVIEIVPESGFYDYYAKYTPGATDEIVPARIPEHLYLRSQEIAIECHKVFGCRGMSRTDMMVRNDDIFVLEINTIPGMTPTSLLPCAAKAADIEFPRLLDRLIGYALERK